MTAILTLNAGSSSLKFSVYSSNSGLTVEAKGQVESLGPQARLTFENGDRKTEQAVSADNHSDALQIILNTIEPILDSPHLSGIGHRVVHGGKYFQRPQLLTDTVVAELKQLSSLAPLHQPGNLAGIAAAKAAFPKALQVGCFDTAFHRNHPWVNDTFALPRELYEAGIRRYGFHGLSYQYITEKLCEDWPKIARGRVIVAHLGNGASLCALQNCVSIGSTMGFSALDGLPMGTRCGQLDPGVILYLLEQGISTDDITTLLYKESGLKGLSGISHDMRTLLESDAHHARQAVDYFTFRLKREIGAMTAVLGGIDALVFCGGIGENAPAIRDGAVRDLDYLGLLIDEPANACNETEISAGRVPILIIPTDEERVIAQETERLVRAAKPGFHGTVRHSTMGAAL
ncbi:MAG: acetate/propionate family kinase [Pseudomonadota bacterium]